MSDLTPIHTLPVSENEPLHEETETCWCKPEVLQCCPQCCPDDEIGKELHAGWYTMVAPRIHHDHECWRCKGKGVIPHEDPAECKLIVHNALTYPREPAK